MLTFQMSIQNNLPVIKKVGIYKCVGMSIILPYRELTVDYTIILYTTH